jgi:hypothetical protein
MGDLFERTPLHWTVLRFDDSEFYDCLVPFVANDDDLLRMNSQTFSDACDRFGKTNLIAETIRTRFGFAPAPDLIDEEEEEEEESRE